MNDEKVRVLENIAWEVANNPKILRLNKPRICQIFTFEQTNYEKVEEIQCIKLHEKKSNCKNNYNNNLYTFLGGHQKNRETETGTTDSWYTYVKHIHAAALALLRGS